MQNNKSKIKFLGTAGARFAVMQQLRASGGTWFNLDNTEFILDPGPGSLIHALNSNPKINPLNLSGIILSHRHLDHSNDLNIMVEAMTKGGKEKRGEVFLPEDALNSDDPVLFRYLRDNVQNINVLKANKRYKFGTIEFETSPRHLHSVETYGFKFYTKSGVIAHITDTNFFKEIYDFYKSDILIINVVCFDLAIKRPEIKHIHYPEAAEIIKTIKPKISILTHFGACMIKSNPEKLAVELSEDTGLKVVSAYDGMELEF